MTQEKLDKLCARAQAEAQTSPVWYRTKVLLLGAAGYLYLFGLIVVFLFLIGGLVLFVKLTGRLYVGEIKILLVLAIIVFAIAKSLWIKVSPPQGRSLTAKDQPVLFSEIAEVAKKLKVAPPHRVLLDESMNAAIAQVPLLGIFGWHRNYLILGLPYLLSTDREQFRAVLAHEFGHFCGAHGKGSVWIYRMNMTWQNLLTQFRGEQRASLQFDWFFSDYVPRFWAYSSALRRENEREADRCSVALVGAAANAKEMLNFVVRNARFRLFDEEVRRQCKDAPLPPEDYYFRLANALREEQPAEFFQAEIQKAVALETRNDDVHPCVRERLASFGAVLDPAQDIAPQVKYSWFFGRIETTAAEEYFGDGLGDLLRFYSEEYRANVKAPWAEKFSQAQDLRQRLGELELKEKECVLTESELVDRTWSLSCLLKTGEARESARKTYLHYPECATAYFQAGGLSLELDDESGLSELEKAISLNPFFAREAQERKIDFYALRKDEAAYALARKAYEKIAEDDARARAERAALGEKDVFEPALTQAPEKEMLRLTLCPLRSRIKEAYLVRKKVAVFSQIPQHVLFIIPVQHWFNGNSAKMHHELLEQVRRVIPGAADVDLIRVAPLGSFSRIRKIDGAKVFDAKQRKT